jgi:hypothetical protein
MPRKALQIIFRHIVPKVVEQQERIEIRRVAETECTAQVNARSLHRGFGFD